MKYTKKDLGKSQIEINFELDEQEFQKYIEKALDHLKKHIKMDGFRPGNVPLKMVEEKVGNENLLMEAGDLAVKESYGKFITENNLEPIDKPEVQILKIAKGNPFLFKVKVALLPEIVLPNYHEIASKIKINEVSVLPQEVDDALVHLQKSRAKFSQKEGGAELKDFVQIEYSNEDINKGELVKDQFILGEGGFMPNFENNLVGMKNGEKKEFVSKFPENYSDKKLAGKNANFKVKMVSVQKMEVPEINDEFAKGLGSFDSLVALKNNLNEGIGIEKKEEERQRKRGEILSKISEKINFDVPEVMIKYEQDGLFQNFKNRVTQNFKMGFEEYLSSVKKIPRPHDGAGTPVAEDNLGAEDEIKKTFRMEAEKRIKDFLVLREIGKKEKIEVSNEEIEEEINKIIKNRPMPTGRQAKEELDKIDINRLKEYTKGTIYNEKIFQRLENLS